MESILAEHEKLVKKGNLSKSVDDVQKTIDLLIKARDSIAASTFYSPLPPLSIAPGPDDIFPFT